MAGHFNHTLQFVWLLILVWISLVKGNNVTKYYTQKLDHFGRHSRLSNSKFQQKLVIDDSHWSGAKAGAPIFAVFGELNGFTSPSEIGLLSLVATEFHAMLIQIEHRFYGDSVPLGSIDLALADHEVRECLSIDQSLEDFAVIIQSLKNNFSAHDSPVIGVGVGYGGALAVWFRLKYPRFTIGALASSTPFQYYGSSTGGDGYCNIVSNDFMDVDPTCYAIIQQSWKIIDDIASQPNGLAKLSRIFQTCKPLRSTEQLKNTLAQLYSIIAQFDGLYNPKIKSICQELREANSIIEGISFALYKNMVVGSQCFDFIVTSGSYTPFEALSNFTMAWAWQRCNELIYPIECKSNTMLPARPFDTTQFFQSCRKRFGNVSHPDFFASLYGDHSMLEYLAKYGVNIIFSNDLKNPLSSGAILKDLSKTVVNVQANDVSYTWEILPVKDDDPEWLQELREKVMGIFRQWINHSSSTGKTCNPLKNSLIVIFFLELLVTAICIYA